MMLRCLYLCVEVGAAFVNCLPVITTSVTGKCLSSSLYLEWFANMILNHSEFSYKITVLSMRAATHKCMNKAMSAYLSLHSNMSLIKDRQSGRHCVYNLHQEQVRVPDSGRDHVHGVVH